MKVSEPTRKGLLFIFLYLFLSSAFAGFQSCNNHHFSNLMIAKSGGMWDKGNQSGFFRVLVYRVGWENSRDIVQFQVMKRLEKAKRIQVIQCRELKSTAARPPIIRTVQISNESRTNVKIRLNILAGPYPGSKRFHLYSFGVDGKISRLK